MSQQPVLKAGNDSETTSQGNSSLNGSSSSVNSSSDLLALSKSDAAGNKGADTSAPAMKRRSRTRVVLAVSAMAFLWVWLRWSQYVGKVMKRPEKWGWDRLAMIGAGALISLMSKLGVSRWSQVEEDPSSLPQRQKMICFHPHGCYVLGAVCNLVKEPRNKNSAAHGTFLGVADALFGIPLVREFLLLLNCRSANANMIESLLANGKSIAICPGGLHEQMATDPSIERVFFPPNLGFIRQALKHGVPLMPLYTFGENQLYDVPEWSRKASQLLKKYTGAGIPLAIGKFGLPLVPKATLVRTTLGRLVEVGPPTSDPTDAYVKDIFFKYCSELHRLFNEHSAVGLPPAVAARGLHLCWRGHESVDLSAEALACYALPATKDLAEEGNTAQGAEVSRSSLPSSVPQVVHNALALSQSRL